MIVVRYWKKTKGEFETDFYKSKEQGRAGKFLLNSLQAINVLRHLQNVTTVGVENYIIQLQWTCHLAGEGICVSPITTLRVPQRELRKLMNLSVFT